MKNHEVITKLYIGSTASELKSSYTTILYNALKADMVLYKDDYQVKFDESDESVTIDRPGVKRGILLREFIDATFPDLQEMALPLGLYMEHEDLFCKIVLELQADGSDVYCHVTLLPYEPFVIKKGIASDTPQLDVARYCQELLRITEGFGLLRFETHCI